MSSTQPGLGNRPRQRPPADLLPNQNLGMNPREATRAYHEKMGSGRGGLALCFVVMCVSS